MEHRASSLLRILEKVAAPPANFWNLTDHSIQFHPFLTTYQPLAPKHVSKTMAGGASTLSGFTILTKPSSGKTTQADKGNIGKIPIFEVSARTLMNATKDLNLRDSAVRRLSKTTWKTYENLKKLKTKYMKRECEIHENFFEKAIHQTNPTNLNATKISTKKA